MSVDLFDRRAVLFLPASRPRAIEKARASAADLVILDLEDAVKPEDKEAARAAAVAAVAEAWPMPVAIRINGVGTEAHGADLVAVLHARASFVVVPSVRTAADLHQVRAIVSHPVMAMIETASAVVHVNEIAHEATGLIVGTNDLAAELRLPPGGGRDSMQFALQSTVLAARAAGVAVFDGVFNRLDDTDGFAAECAESRRLGFDGKTLIHPDQIAPCLAAFAPTAEEIARAERLVAAAGGGAERFENAMIETMHVEAAKRMLARAKG